MLNPVLHEKDALTVIRGENKTLRLEVTKDDDTGREVPVDITGTVVYFTVKERAGDKHVVIQKTSETVAQATITNARGGVAEIYLVPQDTALLDTRDYVYDVWIRYTATERRFPVLRNSTFRVIAGVTSIKLP